MWRCKFCQLSFSQLLKYTAHMNRHNDLHECDCSQARLPSNEAPQSHTALHFRSVSSQTTDTCIPDLKRFYRPPRASDRYDRRGRRPKNRSRSPRQPLSSSVSSSHSSRSLPPPTSASSHSSRFSAKPPSSLSSKPSTFLPPSSGSAATSGIPVMAESPDEFDAACKLVEADISIL